MGLGPELSFLRLIFLEQESRYSSTGGAVDNVRVRFRHLEPSWGSRCRLLPHSRDVCLPHDCWDDEAEAWRGDDRWSVNCLRPRTLMARMVPGSYWAGTRLCAHVQQLGTASLASPQGEGHTLDERAAAENYSFADNSGSSGVGSARSWRRPSTTCTLRCSLQVLTRLAGQARIRFRANTD